MTPWVINAVSCPTTGMSTTASERGLLDLDRLCRHPACTVNCTYHRHFPIPILVYQGAYAAIQGPMFILVHR